MKIITTHKKAFFEYSIAETYEVGIVLTGDEVKSIRKGQVSIQEAFVIIQAGQLVLLNASITPYAQAFSKKQLPARSRVLLAHRREIDKMAGEVSRKGMTIIPLKLFFNNKGYVKLEIGLAKHKNMVDKRRDVKEKDIRRETARSIKSGTRL